MSAPVTAGDRAREVLALPTSPPLLPELAEQAQCPSHPAQGVEPVPAEEQFEDVVEALRVDPVEVAQQDERVGVKGSRAGLEVLSHAVKVCGTRARALPPRIRTCSHHLWHAPDGLTCTRPAGHADGHVYHSTTGSDLGEGAHHGKDPAE